MNTITTITLIVNTITVLFTAFKIVSSINATLKVHDEKLRDMARRVEKIENKIFT